MLIVPSDYVYDCNDDLPRLLEGRAGLPDFLKLASVGLLAMKSFF